jgi:hypothetical protein
MQAAMLLAAGAASLQVRADSWICRSHVPARELELYIAVELLEALIAAHLRAARPEQRAE